MDGAYLVLYSVSYIILLYTRGSLLVHKGDSPGGKEAREYKYSVGGRRFARSLQLEISIRRGSFIDEFPHREHHDLVIDSTINDHSCCIPF